MAPWVDLLVAIVATATAILLGSKVLSWGKFTFTNGLSHLLFASGLGLGLMGYAVLVLGSIQGIYSLAGWGLLTAIWIFCRGQIKVVCLAIQEVVRSGARLWSVSFTAKGLLVFLLTMAALNAIAAMAPPSGVDDLMYHLAAPKIYLREHHTGFIPTIYMTGRPSFLVEMIYTLGLMLHSDLVAQLLNFYLGLVFLVATYHFSRHSHSAEVSLLAGAIVYSISDVTFQSSVALVDVSAAAFLLLSVLALLASTAQRSLKWVGLAGILAGMYAAAKMPGVVGVVTLGVSGALYLGIVVKRPWSETVRYCVTLVLVAGLVLAPWYCRSWLLTGNPIYPFFYDYFGGKDLSSFGANILTENLRFKTVGPRTLSGWLISPWQLTFSPSSLRSGTMGPLFLAFLPLVNVFRAHPVTKFALIFGIVFWLPWYLGYTRLRILLPALALLASPISGAIYSRLRRGRLWRWLTMTVLITWLLVGLAANVRFHAQALSVGLGFESREAYLSRVLPASYAKFVSFDDFQYINRELPEDANILIWEPRGYYLDRSYVWASALTYGLLSPDEFYDTDKLTRGLERLKITHVAFLNRELSEIVGRIKSLLLNSGSLSLIHKTDTMLLYKTDYRKAS